MSQPGSVVQQLLSESQARAVIALASDAWTGLSRMIAAIAGADAELVEPGARLVMPDEIAGEFGDQHLALSIRLVGTGVAAEDAWIVVGASLAERFFAPRPPEAGDASAPAVAVMDDIAGQLVQAVNATTLAHAPGGLQVALGGIRPDAVPAILATLDEPCVLFEGLLSAGKALPFRIILPTSFLELLASAAPGATVESSEGQPAQEPRDQPAAPTIAPAAPVREPTPIMAAPTAQRAHFSPLPDNVPAYPPANIDLLSDLQMAVSVELGRTELSVADVLALGSGSVIELDRLAGEPVDILVNDRLIARGEVVVVDENFGVRIVEVLPRSRDVGKAS